MDQIKHLLALQEAEIIIDSIRSDAQVFPDQLSFAQKEFNENKRKLDEAKTRLIALEAEIADLKHTLELEEQRLEKSKKKTKELTKVYEVQAMKKEIESTQRSNSDLETTILQRTDEIENAKKILETLQASFDESDKKLQEIRLTVETKMGEVESIVSSKTSEIQDLESKCDKQVLGAYKLIRSRKYQDALVPALDGACQGCFMSIPPQMANQMMQSQEKIEKCPNCQRLIFWKTTTPPTE